VIETMVSALRVGWRARLARSRGRCRRIIGGDSDDG
jgi:hypothetical protein